MKKNKHRQSLEPCIYVYCARLAVGQRVSAEARGLHTVSQYDF